MTTWPASNSVKPHSVARAVTLRVPSTLHSSAHSFGPSATWSEGEAAASAGTASGPPVAARIVPQVVARCRRSSNSSATGVGGATSWRVFLFLRNFQAETGQPKRSVSASLRCSTTNSSTTVSSTYPRCTSSSPSRQPCSSVRWISSASASASGVSAPLDIRRTPSITRRPGTLTA